MLASSSCHEKRRNAGTQGRSVVGFSLFHVDTGLILVQCFMIVLYIDASNVGVTVPTHACDISVVVLFIDTSNADLPSLPIKR